MSKLGLESLIFRTTGAFSVAVTEAVWRGKSLGCDHLEARSILAEWLQEVERMLLLSELSPLTSVRDPGPRDGATSGRMVPPSRQIARHVLRDTSAFPWWSYKQSSWHRKGTITIDTVNRINSLQTCVLEYSLHFSLNSSANHLVPILHQTACLCVPPDGYFACSNTSSTCI